MLYSLVVDTRAPVRRKVARMGGECVIYPLPEMGGFLAISNVEIGLPVERNMGLEKMLYSLFMLVPPGRRVSTSDGWSFTPKRPITPDRDPKVQEDTDSHGIRVGWAEIKKAAEECRFKLKLISEHDEGSHYFLEGYEKASPFIQMLWGERVGWYEIGRGHARAAR